MTAKLATLEDLSQALTAAVEEGLARHATGALVEAATTEARLRDFQAPLVLARHERAILSTMLAGACPPGSLDRLNAGHFGGRPRGHAFCVLRPHAGTAGGHDPEWLYQALRAAFRAPALTVEALVAEVWEAPSVPAVVLAGLVDEVIAAAELSEYARRIQGIMARARLVASEHDPRTGAGAVRGRWLRRGLDEAAATLAPALAALPGVE